MPTHSKIFAAASRGHTCKWDRAWDETLTNDEAWTRDTLRGIVCDSMFVPYNGQRTGPEMVEYLKQIQDNASNFDSLLNTKYVEGCEKCLVSHCSAMSRCR
jgi:hypothetical protein